MLYRLQEGIVLTTVCATPLLIPTRAASERCAGIARLNGLESAMLRKNENTLDSEKLCKTYAALQFKSPEDVRPKLEARLNELCEKGFLIAEARE